MGSAINPIKISTSQEFVSAINEGSRYYSLESDVEIDGSEFANSKFSGNILGNDITTPVAVNEFGKFGVDKVFNKSRIAIVPDHFTPNKDIKAAEQVKV